MDTYRRLVGAAPLHTDWGLAILRGVVGFTFFMHGWQKVFEMGIPGLTQMFGMMGVPMPSVTGPLVGTLELVGGALLLVGLASRLAASLLAIDMLVAILLVHLPGGFFLPDGVELVLLLFAGAVTVVLAGPGAFAVDRVIARSEHRSRPDHKRVANSWTR